MLRPKTLLQQQQQEKYRPKHILTLSFAAAEFNALWKKSVDKKSKVVTIAQWYNDLKHVERDVGDFEQAVSLFSINMKNYGPDGVLKIRNPTWKEVQTV